MSVELQQIDIPLLLRSSVFRRTSKMVRCLRMLLLSEKKRYLFRDKLVVAIVFPSPSCAGQRRRFRALSVLRASRHHLAFCCRSNRWLPKVWGRWSKKSRCVRFRSEHIVSVRPMGLSAGRSSKLSRWTPGQTFTWSRDSMCPRFLFWFSLLQGRSTLGKRLASAETLLVQREQRLARFQKGSLFQAHFIFS